VAAAIREERALPAAAEVCGTTAIEPVAAIEVIAALAAIEAAGTMATD